MNINNVHKNQFFKEYHICVSIASSADTDCLIVEDDVSVHRLKSKENLSLFTETDTSYEDLLTAITDAKYSQSLTEDILLRHSQWVIDQVRSYDEVADEDEPERLESLCCIKDLV